MQTSKRPWPIAKQKCGQQSDASTTVAAKNQAGIRLAMEQEHEAREQEHEAAVEGLLQAMIAAGMDIDAQILGHICVCLCVDVYVHIHLHTNAHTHIIYMYIHMQGPECNTASGKTICP